MSIKARPGVNVDAAVTGSELHYRINPDNSTTTIASGTPTIARNISFRQGYDVEGYHKLKRLGKLIPFTPWNQLKYSVSWTGRLHYRQPSVPYNWKTDSNWSHPISLTPWNIDKTWFDALAGSKDTTRYVQSAASAIYSQNFDALTFLSELHKTVAMFKQATIRLLGIAQAFRRFLAKKGKNLFNVRCSCGVLVRISLWLENTVFRHCRHTERSFQSWERTDAFQTAGWSK
jgi:hypothetical protein